MFKKQVIMEYVDIVYLLMILPKTCRHNLAHNSSEVFKIGFDYFEIKYLDQIRAP
jgi:hypothetical protein